MNKKTSRKRSLAHFLNCSLPMNRWEAWTVTTNLLPPYPTVNPHAESRRKRTKKPLSFSSNFVFIQDKFAVEQGPYSFHGRCSRFRAEATETHHHGFIVKGKTGCLVQFIYRSSISPLNTIYDAVHLLINCTGLQYFQIRKANTTTQVIACANDYVLEVWIFGVSFLQHLNVVAGRSSLWRY